MKKIIIPAIAFALGIGLSSFDYSNTKAVDYYYHDGANWQIVPPEVSLCPAGDRIQCELEIEGMIRLIYTQPNFTSPFKRN